MSHAGNAAPVSRALIVLGQLTAAYLALPVVLFLATWFLPWYGLPLAACLVLGCWLAFRALPEQSRLSWRPGPTALQWLVVIVVVGLWAMLGGAGHLFYANFFDWHVRDAVLVDLSRSVGPLAVHTLPDNVIWLLRCPLGYFLVPALIGRLAGPNVAQYALLAWTFLGTLLFVAHLVLRWHRWRDLLVILFLVPLFSGMDWLGGWLLGHPQPLFSTVHLQWWTFLYQYSSNSTQLFWVPNHALAGWLFAAWLHGNWQNPRALRAIPFWIAVVPLWSPLTAIGTLPLLVLFALRHLGYREDVLATLKLALLFVIPAIPCALYLGMSAGTAEGAEPGSQLPLLLHIRIYLAFVLMQFGLLWLSLLKFRKDSLVLVAGIILLLLPFFHFGPNNDLVMRSSIPALMVLCIVTIECLIKLDWQNKAQRSPAAYLLILLTLGAVTPAHEIARAIVMPRWQSPPNITAFVETQAAPHYFARVGDTLLVHMLAAPAFVTVRIEKR